MLYSKLLVLRRDVHMHPWRFSRDHHADRLISYKIFELLVLNTNRHLEDGKWLVVIASFGSQVTKYCLVIREEVVIKCVVHPQPPEGIHDLILRTSVPQLRV